MINKKYQLIKKIIIKYCELISIYLFINFQKLYLFTINFFKKKGKCQKIDLWTYKNQT